MKATYLRLLISGLLGSMFLFSHVFAQDNGTRLRFKPGTTSATVKGTVAKGGPDFYLVGAKAGQIMTVKVTGKVSFGIDSPEKMLTEDDGNTSWSRELAADGDYKIRVFSGGGAQSYSLTVSISPAKKVKDQGIRISSYFNGIKMTSKESGDYGGMAVYLLEADGEWFALVTDAEGVLLRPVLVKVKVAGNDRSKISFTLPNENGGRKFTGVVSANSLILDEGGTKSILKSECGSTYNDMEMVEGGDYAGTEIFLTESDGQWFAVVTLAQGVVLEPKLVEAKVTGENLDKVEFSVPDTNSTEGAWKYSGIITKDALTLKDNGEKTILKKRCNR